MAQPLPTPHNTLTGSNIEIIPGSADHSQINRLIGTPGSTPRQEMGAMRYVLTSCVALAAMTAAALADAPSPTRLSESQLDTITAGLNIDTQNFAILTGCSSCIAQRVAGLPTTPYSGGLGYNYSPSPAAGDDAWVAGYAGPLRVLGVGAAGGDGYSYSSGAAGKVYSHEGGGTASARDGQALAAGFSGPLGGLTLGASGAVGQDAATGASAQSSSGLSLNNLGGTLNLPIGGGKNASFSLRVGIGAPGL